MSLSGNYFAGVDVGSLAAKSVILKDGEIFATRDLYRAESILWKAV